MSGPDTDVSQAHETAWIEVIRKMEEVYSDLIQYEVDLEEKNAALEEAQRFITSVLSSVSDILLVCDQKGLVQQANLAFLKFTDRAEADILGRPVAELLDEDVGALCQWLDRTEREVRFRAREGVTDLVALSCSTRFDHRGLPAGTVLTGRPVGELRRAYEALKVAQAQLVQQEKMASLGRLIAGVAHEINNPISFIVGNLHAFGKYRDRLTAYLAAIHGGCDEDERERLRKSLRIDALMADLPGLIDGVSEGANRVADLVKALKSLSFPTAGPPEPIDLGAVAAKAAQWAVKGRPGAGRLALDLPDGLFARGHAGQVHQVVVNLIENALGAGGKTVRVSARAEGNAVVLEVADDGPGIPEAILDKIFDPFFTTKPVGQGTGLGLWISYGFARDNGGTLEAANRPEGGAVFRLRLAGG